MTEASSTAGVSGSREPMAGQTPNDRLEAWLTSRQVDMNLESCLSVAMSRRWLTILLSLLVMLALAAGARYLVEVDVDVRNHFGNDDPHIVAIEELTAQLWRTPYVTRVDSITKPFA